MEIVAKQIDVPNPPSFPGFGEAQQQQWRKDYVTEFKQSASRRPQSGDEEHHHAALQGANRMLAVPEVTSYEEAMALPAHHLLHDASGPIRHESDGNLFLKTADSKKYTFPIPKKAAKSAEAAAPPGQTAEQNAKAGGKKS